MRSIEQSASQEDKGRRAVRTSTAMLTARLRNACERTPVVRSGGRPAVGMRTDGNASEQYACNAQYGTEVTRASAGQRKSGQPRSTYV